LALPAVANVLLASAAVEHATKQIADFTLGTDPIIDNATVVASIASTVVDISAAIAGFTLLHP
jgi:hypothetical protein